MIAMVTIFGVALVFVAVTRLYPGIGARLWFALSGNRWTAREASRVGADKVVVRLSYTNRSRTTSRLVLFDVSPAECRPVARRDVPGDRPLLGAADLIWLDSDQDWEGLDPRSLSSQVRWSAYVAEHVPLRGLRHVSIDSTARVYAGRDEAGRFVQYSPMGAPTPRPEELGPSWLETGPAPSSVPFGGGSAQITNGSGGTSLVAPGFESTSVPMGARLLRDAHGGGALGGAGGLLVESTSGRGLALTRFIAGHDGARWSSVVGASGQVVWATAWPAHSAHGVLLVRSDQGVQIVVIDLDDGRVECAAPID